MDGSIGLTAGFSYKFGFVTKKSILTGAETTAAWIPLTTAIIASKEFADAVNDKEAAQALADDYADKANKANDELAKASEYRLPSDRQFPYRQMETQQS